MYHIPDETEFNEPNVTCMFARIMYSEGDDGRKCLLKRTSSKQVAKRASLSIYGVKSRSKVLYNTK
jgi:hypothetical protein